MIHLNQVSKHFKTPAGDFEALKPIDLSVRQGEYLAITGPSGSGKSTLLNLIGGIDRPSQGTVSIGGEDITRLNESRLAGFRGRQIGIVFQFFQLIPTLTALENVQMALDLVQSIPARLRKPRAEAMLDEVGLHAHRHKLPAALSGGEQQRVAIARALANDPPILLADEPTGNLDSANSERINDLFSEFAGHGRTVLVATHDTHDLFRYSRRLRLADGRLESDESLRRKVA
jgi:putative ABC transport system ATP-binding protein